MRAAILCPGASVRDFPGRDGFDIVIGVNRAVGAFSCDYWVFMDKYTYVLSLESPSPCIGTPAICLEANVYRQVCRERPDAQAFANIVDAHRWSFDREAKSGLFSATRAMVAAMNFGAKEIVTWGMDWNSETPGDWDGFHDPRQIRRQDRLNDQRTRWGMTVDCLAKCGVSAHRAQEVALVH